MQSKTILADHLNGQYVFEITLHEGTFVVQVLNHLLSSIAYTGDYRIVSISQGARNAIAFGINQELKANTLNCFKNQSRSKLLCAEVMATRPYVIGVK